MKPAVVHLTAYRDCVFGPKLFQCLDANDEPVDLTGKVAFAQVRVNPDAALALDLNATITVPQSGIIRLYDTEAEMSGIEARAYEWDLCLEEAGVREPPIMAGNFFVVRPKTR